MKCADCNTELKQSTFKGIKIDTCPECNGRWFDREELKKAKDNADEDLRWINFDPFSKEADDYSVKSEKKKCPKCNTTMASLNYKKSNIILNKCETCHGVWVHHGEFKKIILYLEKTLADLSSGEIAIDSLKHLFEIKDIEEGIKDYFVIFKLLNLKVSIEHPTLAEAINNIYKYLPFI